MFELESWNLRGLHASARVNETTTAWLHLSKCLSIMLMFAKYLLGVYDGCCWVLTYYCTHISLLVQNETGGLFSSTLIILLKITNVKPIINTCTQCVCFASSSVALIYFNFSSFHTISRFETKPNGRFQSIVELFLLKVTCFFFFHNWLHATFLLTVKLMVPLQPNISHILHIQVKSCSA